MQLPRLHLFYESHPALALEDFETLSLSFIEKRLKFFLKRESLRLLPFPGLASLQQTLFQNSDKGDVVINLSLLNPFIDKQLLSEMIALAVQKKGFILAQGAIPGTAPLFISTLGALNQENQFCYSDNQRQYNTQINLARPKRAKVFKLFLEKFSDLHEWQLQKLLDYNATSEGVEFILAYGSTKPLRKLKACPLCQSSRSFPLHTDGGHPVTGFLTRHSVYYYLCQDCHLVYLNPQLPEEELWRYYDHYAYENKIEPHQLQAHYDNLSSENTSSYDNYVAILPYLKEMPVDSSLLDLGGGTGEFAVYVQSHFPKFKSTLYEFRINPMVQEELQRRGIEFKQTNFLNEAIGSAHYDLITNWEVIEHLPIEKLETYFKKIREALKDNGLYIFSTPDFDNPYCKALDFWAAYPGEHLSVLSRKVLEPLFTRCGFEIIGEHHECVTMKSDGRWFKYGSDFNASLNSQGESAIIDGFLKEIPIRKDHHRWMRQNNRGSEIILCLRKKN